MEKTLKKCSKIVIEFTFPYNLDEEESSDILQEIKDKINETGEVRSFEVFLTNKIDKIKIV